MSHLKIVCRLRKQGGAALVMVLVITSLVAIIAVTISEQTQLGIYLTQNQRDSTQALRYLSAAEQRVILQLSSLMKEPVVSLGQAWAKERSYEIDQGKIAISISDMRACFNLNLMAEQVEERAGKGLDSKAASQLKHLLGLLDITEVERNTFVYRLKDWVDPNTDISEPYGQESLGDNTNPLQPVANHALTVFDELSQLGAEPMLLDKLQSYSCVLPVGAGGNINLNTITSPEVLSAISDNVISLDQAMAIIQSRPEQGYMTLNEFTESQPEEVRTALSQLPLILNSSFFKADLAVSYGRSIKKRSIFLHSNGETLLIYKRINRDG